MRPCRSIWTGRKRTLLRGRASPAAPCSPWSSGTTVPRRRGDGTPSTLRRPRSCRSTSLAPGAQHKGDDNATCGKHVKGLRGPPACTYLSHPTGPDRRATQLMKCRRGARLNFPWGRRVAHGGTPPDRSASTRTDARNISGPFGKEGAYECHLQARQDCQRTEGEATHRTHRDTAHRAPWQMVPNEPQGRLCTAWLMSTKKSVLACAVSL